MLLHRLGRTRRDGDAVVEHGDVLADVHHQAHVVLDEQDRHAEALAQRLDQPAHRLLLGRVHACHRLVEQQQARLGRQRARDLEPALIAVGQALGLLVDAVADAEDLEQLARALVDRSLLGQVQRRPQQATHQARPGPDPGRHPHVVEHAQLAEQPDVLEGPRQPGPRDRVRLQPVDALAVQRHRAGVGPVHAGQQVERRGLAGAVGPDQPVQPARRHLQRQLGHRLEAAERQRQPARVERQLAHRPPPRRNTRRHGPSSHSSRIPNSPCGRRIIIRISASA